MDDDHLDHCSSFIYALWKREPLNYFIKKIIFWVTCRHALILVAGATIVCSLGVNKDKGPTGASRLLCETRSDLHDPKLSLKVLSELNCYLFFLFTCFSNFFNLTFLMFAPM